MSREICKERREKNEKKKLFQFIEKTFPIDFLFLFVFRKVKKRFKMRNEKERVIFMSE